MRTDSMLAGFLRVLFRFGAVMAGFIVGWIVYMIAMMVTVYDGFPSLIVQPFMAALWSGIFVGLSLLLGLILRIPLMRKWWSSSRLWAGGLALISLLILILGERLGITGVGVNPDINQQVIMLHPIAALGGYLGVILSVVNWPLKSYETENGAA